MAFLIMLFLINLAILLEYTVFHCQDLHWIIRVMSSTTSLHHSTMFNYAREIGMFELPLMLHYIVLTNGDAQVTIECVKIICILNAHVMTEYTSPVPRFVSLNFESAAVINNIPPHCLIC